MKIPLLDLTAQYEAIAAEVDAAVREIVHSQRFILGEPVERFEAAIAQLVGVDHAVGCANGTDALLLTLRAFDPEPGDEVVIPSFTFFATAGAVWNAGFRPVFCDVDPDTFNVSAETVEAAWTERTRGTIPVHLFGQMAPMPEIRTLAKERGGFVVEDAAQAIGSSQAEEGGRIKAGASGDAGAFSFFPTKNLGAFGDAGLISTNDAELANKLRLLRVHGGAKMYHHDIVGTNSRLDALQAAVLSAKLPHLASWSEARRKNAALYDDLLEDVAEVITPFVTDDNEHVYNQYTVRARRRDELSTYLSERDIGSGIYYPLPLHLQPCFEELGYRRGDFPVAEQLSSEVLSLPVFPELGEDRVRSVADRVRSFYA
jgi:dTDP-4-amino-4,6-dideoxygalactose transaminase